MFDAIALAKKAKQEEEEVKKKPLIIRFGKALWKFIISNRALFLFTEDSFVRRFASAFIVWKPFEWFILATIMATTAVMAAEHHLPNNDQTPLSLEMEKTENYFLAIFCVECTAKILSSGLLLHEGAYLHNAWNILDFIVVSTGLLTIFVSGDGLGFDLKIIRAFRVLRPLKLISGVPSLQVVLSAILKALGPLVNIALLVSFCIIIFAIIGLEFYTGILHATCVNTTSMELFIVPGEGQLRPCSPDGPDGGAFACFNEHFPENKEIECLPGKWIGPNYGITCFDNIFFGILTVFQCITMEAWTTMMYYTNDAAGSGFNTIFFIPLIVLGSFFMLNLVLGVLSGEFAKEKDKVEGRALFMRIKMEQQEEEQVQNYADWIFTAEQSILSGKGTTELEKRHIMETRRLYEMMVARAKNKDDYDDDEGEDDVDVAFAPKINGKKVVKVDPNAPPPTKTVIWTRRERKFRRGLKKAIKSQAFYWFVIILVFLNALTAAVEHYNQPDWLSDFLSYSDITILSMFIVEMFVKMYGLGHVLYFRSSFNKFDCVVIFASIVEIILLKINPEQSYGISILRSLKLLRVFKVTKYWMSLRNLVLSLIDSMKSILSLLFLLFLFNLIFALLGMQLFGGTFNFDEGTPPANFNTFGVSMLTCFQIITGEDWNEVMYVAIKAKGGAHGIGLVYSIYFVLLVLFGNYTLLNVFLAIACDNLTKAKEMTEAQEEEERIQQELKEKCLQNEIKIDGDEPALDAADLEKAPPKKTKKELKKEKLEKERKEAEAKAAEKAAEEAANEAIRRAKAKQKEKLEKHFNQFDKFDMDFIVGLDSEQKCLIMPGEYEIALREGIAKQKEKERQKMLEAAGVVELKETPTEKEKEGEKKEGETEKNETDIEKKEGETEKKEGQTAKKEGETEKKEGDSEKKEVKIPPPVIPKVVPPPQPDDPPAEAKPMLPYSCCFILGPNNPLKIKIHKFAVHPWFDGFIMLIIGASSIALASEDPIDEDAPINLLLEKLDYGFTAVFTFEMIVKMFDLGMICHPGSYFRDIWNILDFVVVSCALFTYITAGSDAIKVDLSTMKSLRVLRVLRPLKTIKKIPKLKAVLDCVIISLQNVFNIMVVYILFMFIFAVVAVQLFKGRFFYCNDLSKRSERECRGQYFVYEGDNVYVEDREWQRWEFHYDNVVFAFLTLFTIQTGEGWPQILEHSMDITAVDRGPIPLSRMDMSFFYVVYFVVFPFFFVNVFVALIIITFVEQGEKELAAAEVNKNQKGCMEFALKAKPLELYVPQVRVGFSYKCWQLVNSAPFENFILGLISLNTITLMMKWYQQSQSVKDGLKVTNYIFTTLFTGETVLKIIAYGPKAFSKDFWNVFDVVTVIGSIVDAILSEFMDAAELEESGGKGHVNPYAYAFVGEEEQKKKKFNMGVLRLFRATRLIKLLRRSPTIRVLLWTFLEAIKALPYVCLLIAMLFFLYAVVGMQLYGNIRLDSMSPINRHNALNPFPQALNLLFRCATGESWQEIMRACLTGAPCAPKRAERERMEWDKEFKEEFDSRPGQCGNDMAYAYYVSFVFLSSFIMLNLFVAVIMDNFDFLTRDASILGAHHLGEFITAWSEIEPAGTGKAHHTDVLNMLLNLEPPLGFGNKCPQYLAYKRFMKFNMPLDEKGRCHFTTTLFSLIRESLKIKILNFEEASEADMDEADNQLRAIIKKLWPFTEQEKFGLCVPYKHELHGDPSNRIITVGKVYAAFLMIGNYRTYKEKLPKENTIEKLNRSTSQEKKNNESQKLLEIEESPANETELDHMQSAIDAIENDLKFSSNVYTVNENEREFNQNQPYDNMGYQHEQEYLNGNNYPNNNNNMIAQNEYNQNNGGYSNQAYYP